MLEWERGIDDGMRYNKYQHIHYTEKIPSSQGKGEKTVQVD